jgi:hypothetical protein
MLVWLFFCPPGCGRICARHSLRPHFEGRDEKLYLARKKSRGEIAESWLKQGCDMQLVQNYSELGPLLQQQSGASLSTAVIWAVP